jgi:hypothetical protein
MGTLSIQGTNEVHEMRLSQALRLLTRRLDANTTAALFTGSQLFWTFLELSFGPLLMLWLYDAGSVPAKQSEALAGLISM